MKKIEKDKFIGIALPESVLKRGFQSAFNLFVQVLEWSVLDNFHSIIFDVKNSDGKMLFTEREIKKLRDEGIIKCLADNNIEIIAGMRVHDCRDERVTGRRSTSFDGTTLANRVCPTNNRNMEYLLKVAKKANQIFSCEHFHFSYYRYKSSKHCFCKACVSKFAKESELTWEHKHEIFRNPELFAGWILWRADQLINFANKFRTKIRKSIPKAKISIETDLNPERNYHLGTLIDDGHQLKKFINAFEKVYYHIEPIEEYYDRLSKTQKINSDKLKILKYVIGKGRHSGLDDGYIFWELNSRTSLYKAIDLANSLDAKDIVFYTGKPRSLLKMLTV